MNRREFLTATSAAVATAVTTGCMNTAGTNNNDGAPATINVTIDADIEEYVSVSNESVTVDDSTDADPELIGQYTLTIEDSCVRVRPDVTFLNSDGNEVDNWTTMEKLNAGRDHQVTHGMRTDAIDSIDEITVHVGGGPAMTC